MKAGILILLCNILIKLNFYVTVQTNLPSRTIIVIYYYITFYVSLICSQMQLRLGRSVIFFGFLLHALLILNNAILPYLHT